MAAPTERAFRGRGPNRPAARHVRNMNKLTRARKELLELILSCFCPFHMITLHVVVAFSRDLEFPRIDRPGLRQAPPVLETNLLNIFVVFNEIM